MSDTILNKMKYKYHDTGGSITNTDTQSPQPYTRPAAAAHRL